MRRFTGPLPFSIEPHRHEQERKDLNPVWRLWRPPALPGAHSCSRVSGGNRTRRHDLHRVACQSATLQTPSINSPGWIRTSDLSHVTGMSCPLNDGTVSTPTRIRTRNASFEARYDGPFHHRGVERKARESNPHLAGRTALAERPGQPYPATFLER
jgi:hypothetical protein